MGLNVGGARTAEAQIHVRNLIAPPRTYTCATATASMQQLRLPRFTQIPLEIMPPGYSSWYIGGYGRAVAFDDPC
jgi:hypothetical protein